MWRWIEGHVRSPLLRGERWALVVESGEVYRGQERVEGGRVEQRGMTPQSTYIDVEDADGPGTISDQQRRAGIEAGFQTQIRLKACV